MSQMIILSLSTLSAFLLGAWVSYRAMQHKSPVQVPQAIRDMADDMPAPISPYEQEQKEKKVSVKL